MEVLVYYNIGNFMFLGYEFYNLWISLFFGMIIFLFIIEILQLTLELKLFGKYSIYHLSLSVIFCLTWRKININRYFKTRMGKRNAYFQIFQKNSEFSGLMADQSYKFELLSVLYHFTSFSVMFQICRFHFLDISTRCQNNIDTLINRKSFGNFLT